MSRGRQGSSLCRAFNTLSRRVDSFRIYTPTTTACRSLDHQIGGNVKDCIRIVLSQSKIRSNRSCCSRSLLIGRRSIVLTVHDSHCPLTVRHEQVIAMPLDYSSKALILKYHMSFDIPRRVSSIFFSISSAFSIFSSNSI